MKKSFVFLSAFLIIFMNSLFAETTYLVVKGDTLYSISRKYQVTVAELRAANNLSETDVLKAGQKLVIPESGKTTAAASTETKKTTEAKTVSTPAKTTEVKTDTYVIEKGDTLYGIAKKFNIPINDLLELNGLTKDSMIKAGQKIKVSGKANTSTAAKTEDKKTTKTEEPKTTVVNVAETTKTTEAVPDGRTYGKTSTADTTTKWPVQNPTVTPVKGKVSGVQLSALSNEAVTCIHEGTVMYVGTYRGFGQVVFVQSKTGLIYSYSGLGSVKVKKGDYTISGSELGTAGIDSITGNPQITFMVFQNGQPIDPKTAPRN